MGIYLESLLFRIRRHLFQSLLQTWKPEYSSSVKVSSNHSRTLLWMELSLPPFCLWLFLTVGKFFLWWSSHLSAFFFPSLLITLPPKLLRTNLSSDFPLSIWKRLSFPVLPRSSLYIPLTPIAPSLQLVARWWDCFETPSFIFVPLLWTQPALS